MSDVSNDRTPSKDNKVRAKKMSVRIDMTPMVDLAFLLLTFFMLATTFIKPQVMEIILPEKSNKPNDQPLINEKRVLTVVLGDKNRIFWFVGITHPVVNETDYSYTGIREVLQKNNKAIDKMVVLVKPENASTYGNLVDILDELEISNISRYALVNITKDDLVQLENPPS